MSAARKAHSTAKDDAAQFPLFTGYDLLPFGGRVLPGNPGAVAD